MNPPRRYKPKLLYSPEYCRQCVKDLPTILKNPHYNDSTGLITKAQFDGGLRANIDCTGCGDTYVDHLGNCVNPDCDKTHGDSEF